MEEVTPMNIQGRTGSLSERMRVNPVVIDPDASLEQALDMFSNYRFRHLPVVVCNEVVGMISDRDLRLATGLRPDRERLRDSHGHPIPGATKVSEIMHTPVHCMTDEDQLNDAALLMLRESIGAIPICRDNQIVGILTETDVLRAYVDSCRLPGGIAESKVRINMHSPVDTIDSNTKIEEALDVLDRRLGHLIVVDEGCMTGIVSDRDLMLGLSKEMVSDERAQSEGYYAEVELPVQAVMSRPVKSVLEDDNLSAAAELMIRNKFSALPALDQKGSVVGILTQRDIIEEFVANC